jgi:hypothetical protein
MPYNYGYINRTSKRATISNGFINGYNRHPIRLFHSTTRICYTEREVYSKVIYILYK